ncbi:helix-turn-helix domain-containing protein [Nocardia sp. NPDC058176]|uniref:helix-turn-helix domain-containing protein n=1 Tax=Nocardia sp. NPDC058176 TaxID=3346368 RepID=UPI0036DE1529
MTLLYFRLTIAGLAVEARIGDCPRASASVSRPIPSVSADRDTRIREMHQRGLSTREIGAEIGLHHSTVARIVTSTESPES